MVLKVNIWGNLVGSLFWDAEKGMAIFEYNGDFINKGLDVSPLLMPLQRGRIFEFSTLPFNSFKGLPPMISDSLPDDFGNFMMNAWLSREGKKIEDLKPTERLSYVGTRGMGALEYEPILDKSLSLKSNINITELVNVANKVFEFKGELKFKDVNEDALTKLIRIGTSAGGARAKALLALDEEKNQFKAGDVLHGKGHSYWLLKLDGVNNQALGDPEEYGKIEYVYSQMAKDCGIDMTDCRLIPEGNRAHFITKRFDRDDFGEKLHMQTLSGIAAMDYRVLNAYSYEQVFTVLRQMRLPYSDFEQQYKRMVFNVVARNQDDHTKNISFLMDRNGKWSLSPAYDLSFSYNPKGKWTNVHQLSINGKRDEFSADDILKIGAENHIKNRSEIIKNIVDIVSRWSNYAKAIEISSQMSNTIADKHRLLKISRK